MTKKKVFLCGPIRGLSREESLGWRNKASKILEGEFDVIHALRGREDKESFTDPRAVVIRDLNDIRGSDLILVNDTFKDARYDWNLNGGVFRSSTR